MATSNLELTPFNEQSQKILKATCNLLALFFERFLVHP